MKATSLRFFRGKGKSLKVAIAILAALILSFTYTTANAGTFWTSTLTGDADSGISSDKTYTHAYNVGGYEAHHHTGSLEVNGVPFTSIWSANPAESGKFSSSGFTLKFDIGDGHLTGDLDTVTRYFVCGTGNLDPLATQTLTLDGLEVGQEYITTFYNLSYGSIGNRVIDITTSIDATPYSFDENFTGGLNGNMLGYSYTATDESLTFTFTPTRQGASLHFYGFTNEVVQVPEPATIVLLLGALVAMVAIRRVRK